MNKKEKKKVISERIDLANGRFKDSEVDLLYDMVTNTDDYNGKSKTIKNSFTSFCSDGKYTRNEETNYNIFADSESVKIREEYSYNDDDGQTGSFEKEHTTGRDIVNVMNKIFPDR
ncbi:MAG: hypothetical protein K6G88_10645 [Lachnospiraceae bacterium]|nr:hypothetical protein [Lachnospiraceae bacterium]